MPDLQIGPVRADSAPGTPPGGAAYISNVGIRQDDDGIFYTPEPSLSVSASATALDGVPRGWLSGVKSAGVYQNFVCTATSIYLVNYLGVATQLGTGYNLPTEDFWSCCQKDNIAIFTNKNDGMLQYNIDTGGAITAISGAPKARIVKPIFGLLFALDCDGNNRLVRNSDFDFTKWSTGVANYQEYPVGLEVLGVEELGDNNAILIQRDCIRIMQRTNTNMVYTQQILASREGAINPWCIVPANGAIYYVNTNGFKRVSPGGVEPLGYGKVDRYFWDEALVTDGATSVQGAYDPQKQRVRWVFRDSVSTNFTAGVDFDIRANEFNFRVDTVTGIFNTASSGLTMEDLDAYGTMDTITTSLDSRFWYGGSPAIAAYDSSYKFGIYTGSNMAVTWITNTMMAARRGVVRRGLADCDAPNMTVAVATSERIADALSTPTYSGVDESGYVEFELPAGKNMRIEGLIPAGETWTYLRGLRDVVIKDGGAR